MIGGRALGRLDPSLDGVLSLTLESLRNPPPGLPPIKSGSAILPLPKSDLSDFGEHCSDELG
jgi:hypothetical protein